MRRKAIHEAQVVVEDNDNEPTTLPETQSQPAQQTTERIYRGSQEIDHDLFKLEPARMKKNVSFTDVPNVVEIEHCHIFHTVDSAGRPQEACNDVGGHHHDVTVIRTGQVPNLVIGQPVRFVRQRRRGRLVRVSVPIVIDQSDDGQPIHDSHIHAVRYMGSQKIKLRSPNVEAAKFEMAENMKRNPSPIPGIVG